MTTKDDKVTETFKDAEFAPPKKLVVERLFQCISNTKCLNSHQVTFYNLML